MAISTGMQERVEKIEKLIQEGYSLEKTDYGFPEFKSSSGKVVNIFASSPAGFSWVAFFFPFAVCTQIKEWTYFYIAAAIFAFASIIHGFLGFDATFTASLSIGILYGYTFPYLRKIAKDSGIEDQSKVKSIAIGLLLSIVASIPSIILDNYFGNAWILAVLFQLKS